MRESLQFEAAYLMLVPGKHLRLAVRDAADLAERFSLTVYHGTSLGALGGIMDSCFRPSLGAGHVAGRPIVHCPHKCLLQTAASYVGNERSPHPIFLCPGRPWDPYLRVGGIGGKRSPIVPSKSVVIGPILGQKTVWPMYALVYPALLSGSWPEPKILQNFDLAHTHQNIPWAGIGLQLAGPHSREARQIREVRLFPDLMGSALRRPTFSMHSRGLENVYFRGLNAGVVRLMRVFPAGCSRCIDEMVHHLRRTK